MQSKVITLLFTLALVCLGTASCGIKLGAQTSATSQAAPRPVAATPPRPALPPTAPKDPQPFQQFQKEIQSYLLQEKFDLLDSIAVRIRANKERFPGGAWKLNAFYAGVGGPMSGDAASESDWQALLDKLRKWLDHSPDSITAHVGLGQGLYNYAWKARGDGFSDTVTPEGWRLFDERLAMAEKVLSDARSLSMKCPHWYVLMLQIGKSEGWELEQFNKLYDEAVSLEPEYYYNQRVKAMYLMPRWHGEPGEWERFTDEAARKVGGKQGKILYYLIASNILSFSGMRIEENQVSWPKIKEGYELMEKTYGTNAERITGICKLAAKAHETMEICQHP